MKDIEDIFREQFADAETQPPADAWQTIENRLPKRMAAKRRKGRRPLSYAIAAVGAVAAVTVAVALLHDNTEVEEKTIVAQTSIENVRQVPSSVTDIPQVGTEQEKQSSVPVVKKDAGNQTVEVVKQETNTAKLAERQSIANQQRPSQPQTVVGKSATIRSENVAENSAPDVEKYEIPDEETSHSIAAETNPTAEKETSEPIQQRPEQQKIVIPNLVTPNGDGYNDCWVIPDLEKYGPMQVQIYTAQSKRVYSSQDYRNNFCFEGLPDGNYFYIIVFKELNRTLRGVLVVKR